MDPTEKNCEMLTGKVGPSLFFLVALYRVGESELRTPAWKRRGDIGLQIVSALQEKYVLL